MTEIFYRVHWNDCPPLCTDNAWSALWGAERNEAGDATACNCSDWERRSEETCPHCWDGRDDYDQKCTRCHGSGQITVTCPSCEGTGWQPAVRGYSCAFSPEELIGYFGDVARDGIVTDTDQVIAFRGEHWSHGFDGEPTAVPDEDNPIAQTWTWAEFLAAHMTV